MAPQARRKHKFKKAWMHEHVNDPWVREATRLGYRSRAAFKLLELAERDRLFRPGIGVVDLGSSPGGWSQVLRARLGGSARIVAVDVLPMDSLPGVTFIEADFRDEDGLRAVVAALGGRAPDLVLSDMAPNLSGIPAVDQGRSVHLGELALDFAAQWLRPGGDFVVKAFQGEGFSDLARAVARHFAQAHVRKPKSSRDRSAEVYIVGKGRKR